jgi:hypothetical protein
MSNFRAGPSTALVQVDPWNVCVILSVSRGYKVRRDHATAVLVYKANSTETRLDQLYRLRTQLGKWEKESCKDGSERKCRLIMLRSQPDQTGQAVRSSELLVVCRTVLLLVQRATLIRKL